MIPSEQVLRTAAGGIAVTEVHGGGMPVLFLHGSGASQNAFRHQLRTAAETGSRAIAFDLPGHGLSDDAADPDAVYTLPGLAGLAAEVLDRLGESRALVVGWSLGGHVAVELLAARPDLVAGLLLCGAPPVPRGLIGALRGFHAGWDMLLASKPHFTPRDAARFAKLCYNDTADPAFLLDIARADGRLRARVSRDMMAGRSIDQRRTVEASPAPVAFANGEHDPFIRLSYLEGMAMPALWSNRVIADAGHAPFWERPAAFDGILADFRAFVSAHEAIRETAQARRIA